MIAKAPTISKTGPKKLKNDTGSKLIKANPESIDAKNKKINSILISPPFSVEYVTRGGGDWILGLNITVLLQKKDQNIFGLIFKESIGIVLQFVKG
ncbi:hypothetical protein [Neobacillus niacini]|uniref:hypothetical protein n=1 Tax=Neobacillus niacini TaxID=86668 RepID=UPI0039838292